ncbi:MAG: DUF1415 domain-containing protein [Glaciecola sp.]
MKNHETALETKIWQWVDDVIIGEQFCPFAKLPRVDNKVRLSISNVKSAYDTLELVAQECGILQERPNIETTLIALDGGFEDFYEYLDLIEACNTLLYDLRLEGVFQIASFHPQYLFAEEDANCTSHYTNRSPVPIVHIIREQSISKALQTVKHPEEIPQRNIEHAKKLGEDFFKRFL